MDQLINIIDIKPSLLNHFQSENFRWPYQANVINVFDKINNTMVYKAFMANANQNISSKNIYNKYRLNLNIVKKSNPWDNKQNIWWWVCPLP